MGFELCVIEGMYKVLEKVGVKFLKVFKIFEGCFNIMDLMMNGEISMVINISDYKF